MNITPVIYVVGLSLITLAAYMDSVPLYIVSVVHLMFAGMKYLISSDIK